MKDFMGEDFLLQSDTAKELFAACRNEPIVDYHCHLSPKEIAENKKMPNLAVAWLGENGAGDHYKWRQMRTFGVDESYITGNADPYEKFMKWTQTVEHLIGNPLYHWTHLELQRYFGIKTPLAVKSAPAIWEKANKLLANDELSVKGIFEKFNVYAVGTTDDPVDSLEYHQAIAAGTAPIGKITTKVCPSFRPDRAMAIEKDDFVTYIEKLGKVAGIKIKTVDDLIQALEKRLDFFVQNGCRSSDHGLGYPPYVLKSDAEIQKIFDSALNGRKVSDEDAEAFRTKILFELARAYAKRGIVMQLHLNAIRNTNKKMFRQIGADTGFDAVHDWPIAEKLAGFLSLVEENGGLPKTILYTLNPAGYYPMASIMGSFQGGGIRGKIQLGSAWWFLDHIEGMREQLRTLGALGMIPAFVGMLTDSRSFLSYPRHEYFRRILCNLLASWVEEGMFPADMESLKKIVRDISFANAKSYFEL